MWKDIKMISCSKQQLEEKTLENLFIELEKYCYNFHLRISDSWFSDGQYNCEATSRYTDSKTNKKVGGKKIGEGHSIKESLINCILQMYEFGECKSASDIDIEYMEKLLNKKDE